MDIEGIRVEIAHHEALTKEFRKRLRILEQQAAKLGIYSPPHIQIETEELRMSIQDAEHKAHLLKKTVETFTTFKQEFLFIVEGYKSGFSSWTLKPYDKGTFFIDGLKFRQFREASIQ